MAGCSRTWPMDEVLYPNSKILKGEDDAKNHRKFME